MKNMITLLNGLSDPNKQTAVNLILSKFRERIAVDKDFYVRGSGKPEEVAKNLFEVVNTEDQFLEALVKIETKTPLSVFSYVLGTNEFSDVVIHGRGVRLSNNTRMESHEIPEHLLPIYETFLNHLVDNITFISSQKFDTGNSIQDAEIDNYRFNLVHKTVTAEGYGHVIVVRKQVIQKGFNMDPEKYLGSLGVSETQMEAINRFALNGNTIIFGQVGSGKTTLLKYMGNYRLEEKRNLITIEDTSELHIPVPLALMTSRQKKIKELFTATLRQNPSHLIIGETRTDEIVDILESALTISVATTIHANSFLRAIQRIIFMSAERNLPAEQMEKLINAAVDCFIYMEDRKIKEIWVKKSKIENSVYDAFELLE